MSRAANRTSLSGKVVLVTGSSAGIGQGIAVAFAEVGSKVVITGRRTEGLEKTKKSCLAAGLSEKQILIVTGDITNEKFRAELVEKTLKTFGKLDVLINNAGAEAYMSLIESTNSELMDSYEKLFDLNVTSVVDLTKKCLGHIIASKGNIINLSSVVGTKPFSGIVPYSMTKAAVDMFTKGLALEVGPKGVRVNAIKPGCVESEMSERFKAKSVKDFKLSEDKALEMMRGLSVIGLVGQPHDIANLALFLASDDAKFVTGSFFVADGGSLLK